MYAFECFKDLDSIISSEMGVPICVGFNKILQIISGKYINIKHKHI